MISVKVPFYVKVWRIHNANFQSIFAHSASTVTPSKKHYALSNEPKINIVFALKPPPHRVAQKRSVQNLNNKLR